MKILFIFLLAICCGKALAEEELSCIITREYQPRNCATYYQCDAKFPVSCGIQAMARVKNCSTYDCKGGFDFVKRHKSPEALRLLVDVKRALDEAKIHSLRAVILALFAAFVTSALIMSIVSISLA